MTVFYIQKYSSEYENIQSELNHSTLSTSFPMFFVIFCNFIPTVVSLIVMAIMCFNTIIELNLYTALYNHWFRIVNTNLWNRNQTEKIIKNISLISWFNIAWLLVVEKNHQLWKWSYVRSANSFLWPQQNQLAGFEYWQPVKSLRKIHIPLWRHMWKQTNRGNLSLASSLDQ